ncbi:nucleotide pyrophosphohydrolase [Listeria aquatica]|uniref:nucleotide pyrophosphohydrolase n=1 Tax=Listeria aquatica TaxID=1494960 RepID=UPI003F7114F6
MKELQQDIRAFLKSRGWEDQYALKKDLALSISIESAELLECFQWKESNEAVKENQEAILDELADVLIYALQLADSFELDVEEIIRRKLEKNKKRVW